MLKEQVAELLYADGDNLPINGWHYLNHISKDIYRLKAGQILNLFKSEVDKLAVMDDEELRNHLTVNDCLNLYDEEGIIGLVEKVRDVSREAQLQDIKKQLYDLMGE